MAENLLKNSKRHRVAAIYARYIRVTRTCLLGTIITTLLSVLFLSGSIFPKRTPDLFNLVPDIDNFHKVPELPQDVTDKSLGSLPCDHISEDAISAITRAKTLECKQQLVEVACRHEANLLYPEQLQNLCHNATSLSLGDEDEEFFQVRIVFLLTVSGRAVRQVRRLIKSIYHRDHYILIHVDSRHDLMHRELSRLETEYVNVRMVRQRFATIWGGASLLEMLVQSLGELVDLPWEWDFVINLSESDYPIKPLEALVEYLSRSRRRNFVRFQGPGDNSAFVRSQGLHQTFFECDNHMWKIGPRRLPQGIEINGGSDWLVLNRQFATYLVKGGDETLAGLKIFFKYSLMPAETFFHTVLINSQFCSSVVNNNLRLVNWKRDLGCKCQHLAFVDFCGCSPNDFLPLDWPLLSSVKKEPIFFARKFEPVINQGIINLVDERLLLTNYTLVSRNDYWQNIFHHLDRSPKPLPEVITLATVLANSHLAKVLGSTEVTFRHLLEVTSHQRNDLLDGILVRFSAETAGNKLSLFELRLRHKDPLFHKFTLNGGRTLEIAVGTDYDPKEVVFRNLFGAMGTMSEPGLLYKVWQHDNTPVELTFVFYDPTEAPRAAQIKFFDQTRHEDVLKPTLNTPLRPGVWTLLIFQAQEIRGQVNFLVTPQLEDKCVQGGWNISDAPSTSATLIQETKACKDMLDWTGQLADRFFEVDGLCLVEETKVNDFDLPLCHLEDYSSLTDDPKSTIYGLDEITGRMY